MKKLNFSDLYIDWILPLNSLQCQSYLGIPRTESKEWKPKSLTELYAGCPPEFRPCSYCKYYGGEHGIACIKKGTIEPVVKESVQSEEDKKDQEALLAWAYKDSPLLKYLKELKEAHKSTT